MTRQEAEAVIFETNPTAATIRYAEYEHVIGVSLPNSGTRNFDLRTLDAEILRSLVSPVV
jgi:hypothetical protein